MKRTITILCALFITVVASSQEKSATGKFEVGAHVGMTTFSNYSVLSLFQDTKDSYTACSEAAYIGILSRGNLYGIQLRTTHFRTSAVAQEELVGYADISLLARGHRPLTGNWEASFGVTLGVSIMQNSFNHLGEDYDFTRLGLCGGLEFGLNYRFSNGTHLGLLTEFNLLGRLFDKKINLPAGLVGSNGSMFESYSISIQYGISL